MDSFNEREKMTDRERPPRVGLKLMVVLVAGVAAIALYANIQKFRRDKIEQVIVTPAPTATPATVSPAPGE